jgi:flagellin FlaB
MKKLLKLLGNLGRREEGMAGPAAAIILSSFVIVGSSLAFVVVNTGTFSAGEVAETVMGSLDSVLGTLEPLGPVTVIDVNNDGAIDESDHIVLDLRNVPGGSPVLVDPSASSGSLIINYVDAQDRVPGVAYAVAKISGDGDDFLETGELFEITVNPPAGSRLDANETFSLEIVPPDGALLIIERTMSPATDRVTGLH